MNLQRCKNGHFFNADESPACPHCAASGVQPAQSDDPASSAAAQTSAPADTPRAKKPSSRLPAFTLERAPKTVAEKADEDDERTRGFRYADDVGDLSQASPVVGFLVCTRGKYYGRAFPLYDGRNAVGRGADMQVSLTRETTVSRRPQAIVVYDPKENTFFLLPGESTGLCYLNGNAVLAGTKLAKNDRISLGRATLMFLPCCDNAFSWLKE